VIAHARLFLLIIAFWSLRAIGSEGQGPPQEWVTPQYGSVVPYIEWADRGEDKFSQSRRYLHTWRFTYELTGLLPGQKYHVRVSARDPFGNVGMTTGTVTNLP